MLFPRLPSLVVPRVGRRHANRPIHRAQRSTARDLRAIDSESHGRTAPGRGAGYHNQFEGDWQPLHDDVAVIGRALTAQYLTNRPYMSAQIIEKGKQDGRIGSPNSWPIDMLSPGDVYVADGFGKIVAGTLIGDNLGNAIYANSGNGVV